MSDLRETALTQVHVEAGAKMVDFAGWSMPVWYEGATAEHHAIRQRAGLFDLGHMGQLIVTGADAAAALDWSLLLEASAMPEGRARYSMICDPSGGIIDDLIVYRLGPQRWMVVANSSNAAAVVQALHERFENHDDAQVVDETTDHGLIAIQGPDAAEILARLVDIDLGALRYYRIDEAAVAGHPVLVARTGYTGEDGFELFVETDAAPELWAMLLEAGGDRVERCGLAARDTLRLEAGMPLYGNELDRAVTPFDVGAGRLVNLERPSFAVEGLRAADGRRPLGLVGLAVTGRRPARDGYAVSHDGEQIGHVTSGALSPTLGTPIAMARVDRGLDVGSTVQVDVRGTPTDATVVELPFYTRP
ncbi:MAG: glycine cleavage system aminomethyltransferase GcvT [Actinomycetota bacterium]